MKRFLLAALVVALFLGLWQAACRFEPVSPLLLPSPKAVGAWIFYAIADGGLKDACAVTLQRLATGYAPGLALGLLFGCLAYANHLVNDTLGLAALGLQTLPSVCWAPLALLWFGHSEAAMRFVVVMGSVWSVQMATRNSLARVPSLWINTARVIGVSRVRMWTGVMLPAALPGLMSGARLGWAFAWRSLMAAEIYVAVLDRMGLGQMLHYGRELLAMDQTMGVMLAIIILGVAADKAVFLPMERYMHRTRGR